MEIRKHTCAHTCVHTRVLCGMKPAGIHWSESAKLQSIVEPEMDPPHLVGQVLWIFIDAASSDVCI